MHMKKIIFIIVAIMLFGGCAKFSNSSNAKYSIKFDQEYYEWLVGRVEDAGKQDLTIDIFVYEYAQGHLVTSHKFENIQPNMSYGCPSLPESEYMTVRVDYHCTKRASHHHEIWFLSTSYLLQDGETIDIVINEDMILVEEEPK